jgi:hypothetical protein
MLFLGARVKADDGFASLDLLKHEILETFHSRAFVGDFVCEMRRYDHHAVTVAQHHIAGKHRDIAAGDRHVDIEGLVKRQVGRRRRCCMVGRHVQRGNSCGIPKATVGDDAGRATKRQPGNQDRAGRGGARILAGIHHQNLAGRAGFHRDPLRVLGITEDGDRIAVLAGHDVAQSKGLPNHVVGLR